MTNRELMQMSLKELEKLCQTFSYPPDSLYDIINALRARLSEPEQSNEKGQPMTYWGGLAQPEQEPVAWWHDMGDVVDLNVSGHGKPLYFAPPQRECAGTAHDRKEWQGLTFDDWPLPQYEYSADFQIGAQWAEAKLKAKNAC